MAFGYFIPGVRHVTAIAAGSTPLEFRTFAAFAYPGAVLWSCTFVALGYFAGDRWQSALIALRGHVSQIAMLGTVVAVLYVVYAIRRSTSQGAAE